MSPKQRRQAAWRPTGRTENRRDDASIAVTLPWVERTAGAMLARGRIDLRQHDRDEQRAILAAMLELLESQRAAA